MSIYWGMYRQTSSDGTAARAEAKATNLEHTLRQIEDKIDSLALLCQAQWELLQAHTNLTEQDIIEKATEIDLRDGKADGKMGRTKHTCPQCERPLHRRHQHCLYCGHPVAQGHTFQV